MAVTDRELVEASRRGEHAAFGRLVARYQDVVWAVSYSSTRDRALGEDVAQETFIAAWRQLGQLRDAAVVRPWLCGIARNLGRKARRRTRREEPVGDAADDASDAASPFDHTAAAEAEAVVADALARVPERYREVLVLYYREGRSIRDVAETLGLTEANAMQRLTRGRRYLADGVTKLVERSLSGTRPRRDVVAGVLAAIATFGAISRVDASPPKGSTMLKLALASSFLAAGATTAYVVHATSSPDPAPVAVAVPAPAAAPAPAPAAVPVATAVPAHHSAPAAPALPTREQLPSAFDHDSKTSRPYTRAELIALGLDRGPSRGAPDAPVTIVVFQDNQCKYCGTALATLDQLLDEYPNKLRIVVKQFVVHPAARLSAEACYAAYAQGKFWEMHDIIFAHQDALDRDALIDYAHQIGLDVDAFTHALDTHAFAKQVDEDISSGKDVGVQGTPAFLINGRELPGAQPIEAFRKLVDQALADPT
ncbi:MAG TPA: sigma-70 family RNA polymerase sigma factor [Kofleriaceae bacterium]|nr:sigma-70 family RNA polymerase sigma factor [Kofleriaceae bacterium]